MRIFYYFLFNFIILLFLVNCTSKFSNATIEFDSINFASTLYNRLADVFPVSK